MLVATAGTAAAGAVGVTVHSPASYSNVTLGAFPDGHTFAAVAGATYNATMSFTNVGTGPLDDSNALTVLWLDSSGNVVGSENAAFPAVVAVGSSESATWPAVAPVGATYGLLYSSLATTDGSNAAYNLSGSVTNGAGEDVTGGAWTALSGETLSGYSAPVTSTTGGDRVAGGFDASRSFGASYFSLGMGLVLGAVLLSLGALLLVKYVRRAVRGAA